VLVSVTTEVGLTVLTVVIVELCPPKVEDELDELEEEEVEVEDDDDTDDEGEDEDEDDDDTDDEEDKDEELLLLLLLLLEEDDVVEDDSDNDELEEELLVVEGELTFLRAAKAARPDAAGSVLDADDDEVKLEEVLMAVEFEELLMAVELEELLMAVELEELLVAFRLEELKELLVAEGRVAFLRAPKAAKADAVGAALDDDEDDVTEVLKVLEVRLEERDVDFEDERLVVVLTELVDAIELYTFNRFPFPQYSVVLPAQRMLQSPGLARVDEAPSALPQ